MTKQELKTRLKKACINAGISRMQFVQKYYDAGYIPGNSYINAYRYISNMLTKHGSNVQEWLIDVVELQEAENENRTN